jgi:ABC-2 type transport system ATP-binding protein
MDEAEHCHRLAFIQHGQIIARGTPSSLKKTAMPGSVLEIITPKPEELISKINQATDKGDLAGISPELFGTSIHLIARNPTLQLKKIKSIADQAKIKIDKIEQVEPTLEDVFITCMRDASNGGRHEN